MQLPESLVENAGDLAGVLRHAVPFGQQRQDFALPPDLVQHPQALADLVRGNLRSEEQQAGIAGVSRCEPGQRIEHARPRDHHAHAHPSAGPRVAIGHVRHGLLVAGHHEADLGRPLAQRVDGPVQLHPGHAEHIGHAFAHELAGERLAAGHRCGSAHAAPLPGSFAANLDPLTHMRPSVVCQSFCSSCSMPSARAIVWKS